MYYIGEKAVNTIEMGTKIKKIWRIDDLLENISESERNKDQILISGQLGQKYAKIGKDLELSKRSISKVIVFDSFEANSVIIKKCQLSSIKFQGSCHIDKLEIRDCHFSHVTNSHVFFMESTINKVVISNIKFLSTLNFMQGCNIRELEVHITHPLDSLLVSGNISVVDIHSFFEPLNLESLKTVYSNFPQNFSAGVNSLESLSLNVEFLGQISLEKLLIKRIKLFGYGPQARMKFNNVLPYEISCTSFNLHSASGFEKIVHPQTKLSFYGMDLNFDRNELRDIFDLNKKAIFGLGVHFTGKSANVNWPETLEGEPKENQLGYRLIKNYMIEHGNYELESYYHSKELESYYKYQKGKVKGLKSRFDFLFKVGLPYAVSGFGQSLAQPLAWLLGLHIVFTYLMVIFSGDVLNLKPAFDISWEAFSEGAKYWAYSILPTHRLSYNGQMMNPIISLLMRISSSIFIYHIILASRKHLKT